VRKTFAIYSGISLSVLLCFNLYLYYVNIGLLEDIEFGIEEEKKTLRAIEFFLEFTPSAELPQLPPGTKEYKPYEKRIYDV